MGKLLLDSEPLLILPELAVKVGLNESIVLQQFHYWLEINRKAKTNYFEGFYWTYNTYDKWHEQFPFWSARTIQRIVISLEDKELIISKIFNKRKGDKTKWYRINYQLVDKLENENTPSCQLGTMGIMPHCRHVDSANLALPLPETTEIIQKKETIYEVYKDAKGNKLTKAEKNRLDSLLRNHDSDLIIRVISYMVDYDKVNIGYLKTTLNDLKNKGIVNIPLYEKHLSEWLQTNEKAKLNKRKKTQNIANGTEFKPSQSAFTNYKQREYDFDDLEKKLLGWD